MAASPPGAPVELDDDHGGLHGGAPPEEAEQLDLRRGPWTVDEDLTLVNYIADHGEGRWNSLARAAGKLLIKHTLARPHAAAAGHLSIDDLFRVYMAGGVCR
jgi:hypothetical protein